MMAKNAGQGLTLNDGVWDLSLSQQNQNFLSIDKFSETTTIEETIAVVKEKVWSFRNVWRGVAEVLCAFGASPAIAGYSSVPLNEEGYIKEQDEGEAALQKVAKDEVQSRTQKSGWLSDTPESTNLLHTEEEEEDVSHAFAESVKQESDERKSLTKSATWEDFEDEHAEDKKSK